MDEPTQRDDDTRRQTRRVDQPRGNQALPPGFMVGDYEIEGCIGAGGMSTVYSATHTVIGKRVAIKVLNTALSSDKKNLERFVREAQLVNRVGHRNIINVFDFGHLADGRAYQIMDWLPGLTLAQRIERSVCSVGETCSILFQIIDALEAAHAAGVVHRDLKPANILLVEQTGQPMEVKLLDFGVSKLLDPSSKDRELTRPGALVGTPGYASPEQARGLEVDHRADTYALGVVAFEMLLGRKLFVARGGLDQMFKHANEEPPVPADVWPGMPIALSELILRMVSKDRANRPDLSEVKARLNDLNTEETAPLRRYDPVTDAPITGDTGIIVRDPPPSESRSITVGLTIGFVVLFGGSLLWAFMSKSEPTPPTPPVHNRPPVAVPVEQPEPTPAQPPPVPETTAPQELPLPKKARRVRGNRVTREMGQLTVNARPWVQVRVDGRLVAPETPLRAHSLSAGTHDLVVIHPQSGFRARRKIRVKPNQTLQVYVDVQKQRIEVR